MDLSKYFGSDRTEDALDALESIAFDYRQELEEEEYGPTMSEMEQDAEFIRMEQEAGAKLREEKPYLFETEGYLPKLTLAFRVGEAAAPEPPQSPFEGEYPDLENR